MHVASVECEEMVMGEGYVAMKVYMVIRAQKEIESP